MRARKMAHATPAPSTGAFSDRQPARVAKRWAADLVAKAPAAKNLRVKNRGLPRRNPHDTPMTAREFQ